MSAPTDFIDDHDPMAAVCHCECCQGSSKEQRADQLLDVAIEQARIWTGKEVLP